MDQMLRMILDELRGAWRFRWLAIAVAWLVVIAGTVHVLQLPDLYEARAQVYLDTSDPLAPRGRDEDVQLQVAYVRQTLLSTPNIENVARATDLDLRAATPAAFQALVAGLQRDISVTTGADGRRGGGRFQANLYNIRYRDKNRGAAERVVQTLLNTFQEQSLEGDLRDDLQALRFLDSQADTYRQRLERSEAQLADFRREHGGVLPGQTGGFFGQLATLQEQLRQTRSDLQVAQQRRTTLSEQVRAAGSGDEGAGSGGGGSLLDLEAQVAQAERDLDTLRLRYTDIHPSVTSAEERLRMLEARLERRRAELGSLLDSAGAGGEVVANVRIALSQAEVMVAELRSRERDLMARIGELQGKLDVAPQLEAQLAGLTRDYQVLRSQYENLLQRREQMSFEIDRKRQGKQLEFRIIEPPFAADQPVAPERGRLLILVLLVALGAGAGLSYVMHLLRPVFISGHAVYDELQIPVLGAVSMAWTRRASWARRRAEVMFVVALLALFGVFGAVFTRLPDMTALAQRFLA